MILRGFDLLVLKVAATFIRWSPKAPVHSTIIQIESLKMFNLDNVAF